VVTARKIIKSQSSRDAYARLKRAQFRAISKAISDPTRYEILRHIARKDACTCADLRACSPITAATLSHHLKELETAGLITIARKGKFALPSFHRKVWKTYLGQLAKLSEV
jgi:ArsR family transcriptional regulator, arsenate/arsenite/antimonite-responsive transcriptional repressor